MYVPTGLEPLFSNLSFQPHSTPPAVSHTPALQENVHKFLTDTSAEAHVNMIRAFLGQRVQRIELVGHELYRLFDKAVFDTALQPQDEASRREFLDTHSQPITSCTIRFHLQCQDDLYTLVTQLKNTLFPTATTPFRPHPTNKLTGFALGNIHYMFCINLARPYFATIDSVRLDITSGSVHTIDDGMFSHWVEDTVTKTIRIPQLESCFGSKHLCTLIAQGYKPTEDAYTLLTKEGLPPQTLIEKLAADFQDKDEASAFFTLVVFRALEAIGQTQTLPKPSGNKLCSNLLLLAHENNLSFTQLQALLCILGPALTAHAACTKRAVSYRFCIDNRLLQLRIPYIPNSTEEQFCSISPQVFTSSSFTQLCAFITKNGSPIAHTSPAPDKNLLKDLFLTAFIHAMGSTSGQTAAILTSFSTCYYHLAPPVKQLLVHILQHILQIPYEPNGAKDEGEFIEELLTTLIPHTNPQVASWAKQLLVQLTEHSSFKEKYISTQDISLSLRLIEQLQETVSTQVVATFVESTSQQELALTQLVSNCPNLCTRLYTALKLNTKWMLLQQQFLKATIASDNICDFISLLLTELQQKTANRLHVEWLCTLPKQMLAASVKPFERVQILMYSCLQFPEFQIKKELIQPLSNQLQTSDKEQLYPLYREIEQKKLPQAALFVSCVPPRVQVSFLLAEKPTQKQKNEWKGKLLKQLGQGVSTKCWEKAFDTCSSWLEYDVISDMILLLFRNRNTFKALPVWEKIVQHPNWLRSEHMSMLKEASYFLGLFPPCSEFQTTLFIKLLRHVKEDATRLQEYANACVVWFQAIDPKQSQKNSLGFELFSLLCQNQSEIITKEAHVLSQALKPYFLTFKRKDSAVKTHNRTRINILDCLIQHVKAVRNKISKNHAADMLVELIALLYAYEDNQTDDFLLTALSNFPHTKVLDALFETWARIFARPIPTSDIQSCALALTERMANEASLDTVQRLFAFYFLRDGVPSEKVLYRSTLPKSDAPEEIQKLYRSIAPGYKRMLMEALRSLNPDHAKNSLDIAFAILFSPIKPAPLLLAQPIANHFDTIIALFLRVYAQEGFTDPVNLLFEHLLSHAVDDKICDPLKEQIEFTSMPLCHKGFYQYWLLGNESYVDTIVSRPYTMSKADPLESEKAYITFLHILIHQALRSARSTSSPLPHRARLLDLAVSHIRTLIETYPTTSGIAEMIQMLKSCVTKADPLLFEAHTSILEGLEVLREPAKRAEDTTFLPEMQQIITQYLQAPNSCTEATILELQHMIFNWVQRHAITSFLKLLSCIEPLLKLIEVKNLVDNAEIHDMMYMLFIPHLQCFGEGQGEAGHLYALNASSAYCHLLSKSAPKLAVDFAIDAYLGGAFEGHYEGFSLQIQAIVLAVLSNIQTYSQPEQTLNRLAVLVTLPVKTAADCQRKNLLVAELVQHPTLSDQHRLITLEALLEHQALHDFEEADLAITIQLLCFIRTQEPDVRDRLFMKFWSQLGHLRAQLIEPSRFTVRIDQKGQRK